MVVGLSFVLGRPLAPPDEATETVVIDLLRNVYQAFDYREESDIYDTLERSVSGDLLTEVYLEVRRALRLESQGGARTKVKELDLVAAEVDPEAADSGFVVTAEWTVLGAVGHWGHIHTRRNRYEAVLTIEPVEGAWKLTRMQLLDEERL